MATSMTITQQSADRVVDPREVRLSRATLETARRAGCSLSALLEEINPSQSGDKTDAFQRQLLRYNIRTRTDLERGIPASSVDDFWHPKRFDGTSIQVDDFAPRDLKQRDEDTQRFFMSNQPQSWALFPEFINRILRVVPLANDVLATLIAETTMIDSQSYQAIYLQDTVLNRRTYRVGEDGALPRLFVKVGAQAVSVSKYGALLEGTYEYSRRIKLPIFTILLQRIRQQMRLDLAAEAINVLINGDGNNNAALNYNVSALDPTAPAGPGPVTDPYLARIGDATATSTIAKRLTYQAWLSWRTSLYALKMTHVTGRMNEILQLLQIQMPSINPTLLLALLAPGNDVGMGKLRLPEDDMWGDIQVVYLPFAPGGLLTGINNGYALEMLMEQGSDLTETDKDIENQRDRLAISQVTGFAKIITSASSTLTFA